MDKHVKYVICKNGHNVCIDCLTSNHESNEISVDHFVCPTCNKPSDSQDNDQNAEHYYIKASEQLKLEVLTHLDKNKLDMNRELRKLNTEAADELKIIMERQAVQRAEIIEFFNKRGRNAQELLDNITSSSKKFTESKSGKNDSECSELISKFQKRLHDLQKEILENRVFYQRDHKRNKFKNSTVSIIDYQQPIIETKIYLNKFPRKVIVSKNEFYAFTSEIEPWRNRIYKLSNNESNYCVKCAVEDLSIDEENEDIYFLCPMLQNNYQRDKILLKVGALEKRPEIVVFKTFSTLESFKNVQFKNSICFSTFENFWIFNKKERSLKLLKFSNWIQNFKIIGDNAYILQQDKKVYRIDSENKLTSTIDVMLSIGDFSIREDIINKLDIGNILLTDIDYVFIVDPIANLARYYHHQKIFEDGRITSYLLTDDKVIFCLRNKIKPGELIFKHYERKIN
ncbi:unnamed protein product [Dimorphilus gyrociliatus]|uniref:Uncharacterized protein n=1 Tax=Dimorphilus gyrociliatus TaxID=2664684 RepID=A0A7I8VE84_9ANNE|nr:unnamed protein product [Dimorphilus gyrociliatus]